MILDVFVAYSLASDWPCTYMKKHVTTIILVLSAEYRPISHLFGVRRSTVCEVVHESYRAIVDYLTPPSVDQQQKDTDNLKNEWDQVTKSIVVVKMP